MGNASLLQGQENETCDKDGASHFLFMGSKPHGGTEHVPGANTSSTAAASSGSHGSFVAHGLCGQAHVSEHESQVYCISVNQHPAAADQAQCLKPKESCYETVTSALSFDEIKKLIHRQEADEEPAEKDGPSVPPSGGGIAASIPGGVCSNGRATEPMLRFSPVMDLRAAGGKHASLRSASYSERRRGRSHMVDANGKSTSYARTRARSTPPALSDSASCRDAVAVATAGLSLQGAVFPAAEGSCDENERNALGDPPMPRHEYDVPNEEAPPFWMMPRSSVNPVRCGNLGQPVDYTQLLPRGDDSAGFFEDSDFEGFQEVVEDDFLVCLEQDQNDDGSIRL